MREKEVFLTTPFETDALQTMYEYFELENNIKLQQKVVVDIMMHCVRSELEGEPLSA